MRTRLFTRVLCSKITVCPAKGEGLPNAKRGYGGYAAERFFFQLCESQVGG